MSLFNKGHFLQSGLARLLSLTMVAGSLTSTFFYSAPVKADSYNADCAIWICLPAGFGEGCEKAHAAFIRRVTHFPPRPPMPPWSACESHDPMASDGGELTTKKGRAAFVPERDLCSAYEYRWNGMGKDSQAVLVCSETKHFTEHHVLDQTCTPAHPPRGAGPADMGHPAGCSQTTNYIETLQDGMPLGDPYYY